MTVFTVNAQDSPAPQGGEPETPELNNFDFGPLRTWNRNLKTVIGSFTEADLTGIGGYDNDVYIGMKYDPTVGNYIFIGSLKDSIAAANNGRGPSGIKYYPLYNKFEITTPFQFFNTIMVPSPSIKIGGEDGPTGQLIIQGKPASNSDDEKPIGTIMVDDNFLYYRTSTGVWKMVALFAVPFSE